MTNSFDPSKVIRKLRHSGFKKKRAHGMAEVLADMVPGVQENPVLDTIEALGISLDESLEALKADCEIDRNQNGERFSRLEGLLKHILEGQTELLKTGLEIKRLLREKGDAAQ